MSEEVTCTRVILNREIEEKFPINYDAIQELAENASKLSSCLYAQQWGWYKEVDSKYVEYMAFREVLVKFYINIVNVLLYVNKLEDFKVRFLAYRLLFNLVSNDDTNRHIGILNRCNYKNKAWELFNRIEYLINNFETEILLSDTEDTENVGY